MKIICHIFRNREQKIREGAIKNRARTRVESWEEKFHLTLFIPPLNYCNLSKMSPQFSYINIFLENKHFTTCLCFDIPWTSTHCMEPYHTCLPWKCPLKSQGVWWLENLVAFTFSFLSLFLCILGYQFTFIL